MIPVANRTRVPQTMLTNLHIRNFAIIDEAELELDSGMTTLTGETGAGKSILLDALGLVLGDRADSNAIREGARRAEIIAEFDTEPLADIADWLVAHELDDEGACQLRRVIGADGRSKGYINGRPVPLSQMRQLGERLVDIHGQHEHQSLRLRNAQRALLDAFGEHDACKQAVAEWHRAWRDACAELSRVGGAGSDRDQRLDLLNYQVQELEALELQPGEIQALDAEHRRLANAGRLLESCQRALSLLHEEETSAHTLVSRTSADLAEVADFDETIASAVELIDGACIQIDEATGMLRALADRVEMDPGRLEWIEQRLGAIHDLARKHQVEPTDLSDVLVRLQGERDELLHADERAAELEQAVEHARAQWAAAAEALTEARTTTAARLAADVTEEM